MNVDMGEAGEKTRSKIIFYEETEEFRVLN